MEAIVVLKLFFISLDVKELQLRQKMRKRRFSFGYFLGLVKLR